MVAGFVSALLAGGVVLAVWWSLRLIAALFDVGTAARRNRKVRHERK